MQILEAFYIKKKEKKEKKEVDLVQDIFGLRN